MIRTIFFDMNETLLSFKTIQIEFSKHFKDKNVMKYWFSKLLHSSLVMGANNEYIDFGTLSKNALRSVFYENDMELTKEAESNILSKFRSMQPYDDVIESLKYLKEKGIRIIPLTNSSNEMQKEQLINAGLMKYCDARYTVDSISKYKPFKEMYLYALEKERIKPKETAMIATHDWDLFGANKAGLTTGYVQRKKTIYNPSYSKADYSSDNLLTLVKEIANS